jgi:hypothetical protein
MRMHFVFLSTDVALYLSTVVGKGGCRLRFVAHGPKQNKKPYQRLDNIRKSAHT